MFELHYLVCVSALFVCRVGCGSFGEVFEGKWRNSIVAVKKIRIHSLGLSQEEKEEFQQEAAIMRYVYPTRLNGQFSELVGPSEMFG